jgi:hypothetical protein
MRECSDFHLREAGPVCATDFWKKIRWWYQKAREEFLD